MLALEYWQMWRRIANAYAKYASAQLEWTDLQCFSLPGSGSGFTLDSEALRYSKDEKLFHELHVIPGSMVWSW